MNSYGMCTKINRSGRAGFCSHHSLASKHRSRDCKAPLPCKQQCIARDGETYPCEDWPRQQQENLGRRGHSSSTIQRMSIAATGRRHSRSTIQKITESQSGRTLSASHKAAIAAGQRRRHATRRLLVAMEALHQELAVTCEEIPPEQVDVDRTLRVSKPETLPLSDTTTVTGHQGQPDIPVAENVPSRVTQVTMFGDEQLDDVHREYAMRLKSFRQLQSELRPWMDTFRSANGRKPGIQDAKAAQSLGVYEKFLEFQSLKDSLMVEIPAMRAALGNKDTTAGNKTTRTQAHFNSNKVTFNVADAASRLQSAREYRRRTASSPLATDQSSVPPPAHTTESRLTAMQSKASQVSRSENPRAKAALLKALAYKQRRAEEALTPKSVTTSGTTKSYNTGSAVKLVSVEGKAIGGIDYSGVDASRAAAGESTLIKAGVSPVQSYRKPGSILDKDDVGLADAMQAVQGAPVPESGSTEGTSMQNAPQKSRSEPAIKVSEDVPCTATTEESVETLYKRLNCPGAATEQLSVGVESSEQSKCSLGSEGAAQPSAGRGSGNSLCRDAPRDSTGSGDDCGSRIVPENASMPELVKSCSTVPLLELRGKQAAATAAVEAAAAAAVAAVQAGVHSAAELEQLDMESPHVRLIDAMCEAARNAREVHAEFEAVRGDVMQGLKDAPETYFGGLVLLSRIL